MAIWFARFLASSALFPSNNSSVVDVNKLSHAENSTEVIAKGDKSGYMSKVKYM